MQIPVYTGIPIPLKNPNWIKWINLLITFPDEYVGWCHAENMYMEKYEFDHKKKVEIKSEQKACFDIY